MLAGGGAYYFAKQSVNAERRARHEADIKRRRLSDSFEFSSRQSNHMGNHRRAANSAGSQSTEASRDPASTKHAQVNDGPTAQERSKYEASEPFRAKKERDLARNVTMGLLEGCVYI